MKSTVLILGQPCEQGVCFLSPIPELGGLKLLYQEHVPSSSYMLISSFYC